MRRFWREWLRPLLIIIAVLSTVRSTVADWNDVPSGSMKPTILEGDRIFVNKLAYDLKIPFTTRHVAQWDDPQRGDIVVFFSPEDGKRLVKRVVAVPGDRIALRDNRLYINGEPARYSDADPQLIEQLDPIERANYLTAIERVEGVAHPVMVAQRPTPRDTFGVVEVPADRYFVMGDNRDHSRDSRTIGVIDRRLIVGRATAVVLSFDRDRYFLPRWGRFFTSMP